MKDFEDLPRFSQLKNTGLLATLQNYLEDLLNCEIKLQCKMSTYISNHNLFERPERTSYKEDELTFSTVSMILENKKIIALFGIRYHGLAVSLIPNKLFDSIASTLTHTLSDLYNNSNSRAIVEVGEKLIRGIIANVICRGGYNNYRTEYLIEYFMKIKSLTFEGTALQTGMILTKAYHSFKGKNGENRDGLLSKSDIQMDLIRDKELNKRNWYLVDGKTSYYVFSKDYISNSIYVLNHNDIDHANYLKQYLLENTLSGTDIVLRIINPNHLSIINSLGMEFICLEGVWHVRAYNKIVPKLMEICGMSENNVNTLLFFIIQLSQKCKSSIMFIPESNEINYDDDFVYMGVNILGEINIGTKMYTNNLLRILSSDGVTIISKEGLLIKHGAIVKLEATSCNGELYGTGQIAAMKLGSRGTSIKISSDGTVKIMNIKKNVQIKF